MHPGHGHAVADPDLAQVEQTAGVISLDHDDELTPCSGSRLALTDESVALFSRSAQVARDLLEVFLGVDRDLRRQRVVAERELAAKQIDPEVVEADVLLLVLAIPAIR